MSLAWIERFSLDILLSSPAAEVEDVGETVIYHPGDTVSGFLRIIGHANTVLDSVSVVLEGAPGQRQCARA